MNAGSESVPTPRFARHAALEGPRLGLERLACGENLACLGQQALASGGQRHARRGSLKQRQVEFVFERLDLGGQRRLADVQLLGRAGQMARFGNGGETSEAIEIHQWRHCTK